MGSFTMKELGNEDYEYSKKAAKEVSAREVFEWAEFGYMSNVWVMLNKLVEENERLQRGNERLQDDIERLDKQLNGLIEWSDTHVSQHEENTTKMLKLIYEMRR